MRRRRTALLLQIGALFGAIFLSYRAHSTDLTPNIVPTEEAQKVDTLATVKALVDKGRRHQNAGDFEAALEKYQAALALARGRQTASIIIAGLWNLLASASVHLGRWQDIVEASTQAIHINPADATAHQLLGLAYSELHRSQEAETAYKEAIRLKPDYAEAYHGLGLVYKNLRRYQKAEEAFKAAIRIKPDFTLSYLQLGLMYDEVAQELNRQGRSAEAIRFGEQALTIYEKVLAPYHSDTALFLNNLAESHARKGEYAKALMLHERALTIREKALGPDHLLTAFSLNNLAESYRRLGDYAKALPPYERALTILGKTNGPDHPDTATVLNNMAALFFDMGDSEKAISISQKVLAIREKALGLDHPDTTLSLNNLAVLYGRTGRYAEALLLQQRALAIREEVLGPDHPDTATSLDNLAGLYTSIGDYAKALPLYQRALAIREKGGGPNRPDVAVSLNNLAALYHNMRDDEKALQFSKRALMIREKVLGPNHPDTALSLNNLAALYNDMGEYAKAMPLHERALAIREKALGPSHPDTALSLSNLAESYVGMGKHHKALPFHERALTIKETALGLDHPSTALSLNNLATMKMAMGNYAEALPFLQQALAIYEKSVGPDHRDVINPLGNLAVAYQSMEDHPKALQVLQRGLAAEERTFANVFSVASEDQKLLFTQKSQGTYWNALSLIHRHFQIDPQTVRFGLEFVLRRKGIVVDAQARAQEALAANLKGEGLESWQRLTQHRSMLSRLLLGGSGELKPEIYKKRTGELQTAITKEEEFLAQRSGLVAQELAQRQITGQMVASRLSKDSALVEFVRIRDWDEKKNKWSDTERYLAFVLTPDNQVALTDLGEVTKIDSSIKAALTAINPPDFDRAIEAYSRQADAELAELYRLLLQPLEAVLGTRERLIVSPNGELNKLPFAALRTPDGHYLVEKMTLSYVASGRDLLRGKTNVSPTVDLLLVANPAFDDKGVLQVAAASGDAPRAADYGTKKFTPLPGTAEEARVIPPLIKGTHKVLEGKQATESAVHTTTSPKVLHLATHGFFLKDEEISPPDLLTFASVFASDPGRGKDGIKAVSPSAVNGRPATKMNPMVRSGLALAGANHAKEIAAGDDGILTALEVTGMNLYGTDLVVLSACETGVGDVQVGEGVYGLRRAFVLAGAKNLAMSLWPVGDSTTREQMETFYKAYTQGKQPAEALRRAQLHTIANLRELTATMKEPLAPVKLWAPFIVQQTGE
ncbi:MAG: tetratricopeptide repeat protein [Candidatus Binatia bacterium]